MAAAVLVGMTAGPAGAAPSNDPLSGEQWGLAAIKAPEAWLKGFGAGIRVAIVSSGIASHPDLTAKLDGGFDATGNDPNKDSDGRGTHLAGIVGAHTSNTVGIAGVAPDARLLPYKAFENDSSVDTGKFLEALQSAARAKPQVVLVDVPSGFPADGRDLLRQSLSSMAQSGISVVVGAVSGLTLADLPVVAVAASTQSGEQQPGTAAVGNEGVAAPGRDIISTTATSGLLGGAPDFDYGTQSGAGAAAAHAAGAVAIVRGVGANAGQAAGLLRATARKTGDPRLGAGIIDAAAAVGAFKPAAPATTVTTKKAAAPVTTSKATGVAAIPKNQPAPPPTGPQLRNGEPAELGDGEAPVVPPGAEEFYEGPGDGGARVTIVSEGEDRPMGTLAIGFAMLFGVGTGLSLTFRRLADAAA